jgi:hypothetical protein
MNLVALTCKCCGDELLCPWGVAQVGKIVETVAIMVQIPWKDCPTCGYSLEGLRFNTPTVGVKHQQKPNHPGLKGLR